MQSVINFFSSNSEAILVNVISSAVCGAVIFIVYLLLRNCIFFSQFARFFKLTETNAIDLVLPTINGEGEVCVPSAEFEAAAVILQVFKIEAQIEIPDNSWYNIYSTLRRKLKISNRTEFKVTPVFSRDFSFESEGNNPCMICLGGPCFNIITSNLIGNEPDNSLCDPFFRFAKIGEKNVIIDCETNAPIVKKDNEDKDYGILQKLTLKNGKGTVIIAAGLGRNGTYTATDHLIYNWEEIYYSYGNKDFGMAFMVPFIEQKVTGLKKEGMVRENPFFKKSRK